MASTYTLISSQVLASSAASVTFSSIPATYTDLCLKFSTRGDYARARDNIVVRINGDATTTYYSETHLQGLGSSGVSSDRDSSLYAGFYIGASNEATSTASTFASAEVYIPSYTVTGKKPISANIVQEDNNTIAIITATAALWNNTTAVSQIDVLYPSGINLVAGCSFYLYGIKNS